MNIPFYHHSYLSWFMRACAKNKVTTIKSHTTADGCLAIIKDNFDGKLYKMTIEPIRSEIEIKPLTAEEKAIEEEKVEQLIKAIDKATKKILESDKDNLTFDDLMKKGGL